eukprot:m.293981 g.293981  ORF g.293981 m.293981 type:complete len:52 (+) comp27151_c0_seq1:1560-1715(+)
MALNYLIDGAQPLAGMLHSADTPNWVWMCGTTLVANQHHRVQLTSTVDEHN